MKEELYPRLEALCRLCLKEIEDNFAVDIFRSESASAAVISIPMRIMACAALEVQPSDGLPKTICTDCRYQLEKSYYFRKRSQAADNKLRKHIRLLGLGKRSRVFAKNEEEDDDDEESEFEDSLIFLKEHEIRRSAEQERKQSEWKKLALHEFEAELKEGVRAEVREELRSSVVAKVKDELRVEVREAVKFELRYEVQRDCIERAKQDLRAEVQEDCYQRERTQLLEELENFLDVKKQSSHSSMFTQKLASAQGEKEKSSRNKESTSPPPLLRAPKRRAASAASSLLHTKQKHRSATMLPKLERSLSSLPTAEMEEIQTETVSYQVALMPSFPTTANDAVKIAPDEQEVDDVMAEDDEPNFYILESDDGNELDQTHAEGEYKLADEEHDVEEERITAVAAHSQKREQQSLEAEDSSLFISEDDSANFQLTASDSVKKKRTTSYQKKNATSSRRIRRGVRERATDVFELSDTQFVKEFRLNKLAFKYVLDELKTKLPPPIRSSALTPELKLAACLRFLGQGGYQNGIGQNFNLGIAQPTMSVVLTDVFNILEESLCPKWITLQMSEDEKREANAYFYEKSKIPGIIMCIDGTHVKIVKPGGQDAHLYYNRKFFYSLNTMVICDHKQRIRYVAAKYPGASQDSFIWENSDASSYFKSMYDNGERDSRLLGGAGYPLTPWLITPFRNAGLNTPKSRFNTSHSAGRNIIERTIGLWKNWCKCLLSARQLHYTPKKAVQIINVAAALHNIRLYFEVYDEDISDQSPVDEEFEDELEDADDELHLGRCTDEANLIRNDMLQNFI